MLHGQGPDSLLLLGSCSHRNVSMVQSLKLRERGKARCAAPVQKYYAKELAKWIASPAKKRNVFISPASRGRVQERAALNQSLKLGWVAEARIDDPTDMRRITRTNEASTA